MRVPVSIAVSVYTVGVCSSTLLLGICPAIAVGIDAGIGVSIVGDHKGRLQFEWAGKTFADRTHWMRMLKEARPEGDLAGMAEQVLDELEEMGVAELPDGERVEHVFRYPVLVYPDKVKSHNLDKTKQIGGTLHGIKGQYLIFDTGVINLRKFTGYEVEVSGEAG